MKNWVFDEVDAVFIKTSTGERVGLDEFRVFQAENHSVLRGVAGEQRLERYLETNRPAEKAKDAPLMMVDLREPKGEVFPASDVAPITPSCMVCGHEIHAGTCQIV